MLNQEKIDGNHILLGIAPVIDPNNTQKITHQLLALSENRSNVRTPSREILNLVCVGMPGSGKSRIIEANLLSWNHSAVVVDLKGSLYETTAAYRATLGPVIVLDVRYGSGSRINPVALTSHNTRRTLAIELVTQGEKATGSDRFWANSAVNAWLACWYAADDVNKPHIPYAVELLSKDLVTFLVYMHHYHYDNKKVRRLMEGFVGEPLTDKFIKRLLEFGPSKLLGNKWGSVEESVTVFSEDDNMMKIFSGNDLDVDRMFKRTTTIYIIADENNAPVFQAFVRLVMRAIGERLIAAGDKLKFEQRKPVLFLFDEFGAAPINNVRVWLNTMRSRGIVLWLFAQSVTQLPSEGRRDYDPNRENSVHHWLLFAPSYGDSETGEFISRLSGKTTVRVKGGISVSQNSQGMSESISSTYKEKYNFEPEDIDEWGINQLAISIRPNGTKRQFYGGVWSVTAENLGLDSRRGTPAEYHPLPPYELVAYPDPPLPSDDSDDDEPEPTARRATQTRRDLWDDHQNDEDVTE